jgi:hypothetical protein
MIENVDVAGRVLTILFIIYVVGLLWGLVKHLRVNNLIELGVMFCVMYVGWTIRTWPSRHKGDGMAMSLAMAWRDSILTILYLCFKLFGLVDVWHWIERFFQ